MFKISKDDEGISYFCKKEANILLNRIKKQNGINSEAYYLMENLLKATVKICSSISKMYISNENQQSISNFVNSAINGEIFSPLTLNEDEFDKGINIRFPYIIISDEKVNDSNIINRNAFRLIIKHAYSHNESKEYCLLNKSNTISNRENDINNLKVELCKGGVLIGKYFELCYIPIKVINTHDYYPEQSINIPVSAIYYNNDIIYTMDAREPAFKTLCKYYDVPIKDSNLLDKIDIRKYDKLPKTAV